MPVNRIAIDGLWRCLCPSIDYIAFSQTSRPLPRARKAFARSEARAKIPKCLQARDFSISNRTHIESEGPRIRFHVTKEVKPDSLDPKTKKGWERLVPGAGGKEENSLLVGPLTSGRDDERYWRLKRERAERAGYGLTERPPGKGGIFKGVESNAGEQELSLPLQDAARPLDGRSTNRISGGNIRRKPLWGLGLLKQDGDELGKSALEQGRPLSQHSNDAARSLNLSSAIRRTGGEQGEKPFWGIPQTEPDDEQLAKKLQESSQRRPQNSTRPLKDLTRIGKLEREIGTDNAQVSEQDQQEGQKLAHKGQDPLPKFSSQDSHLRKLDSEKVEQAKWPSKALKYQQDGSELVELPNRHVESRNPASWNSMRPMWVPHREFGEEGKRREEVRNLKDPSPVDSTHERSPIPRDERAAFFQSIREQRRQVATNLSQRPQREHNELPVYMRQKQAPRREPNHDPLPLWRLEKWEDDEIEALHDRLRAYRTQEGNYDRVVGLVEYLIQKRGEKPSLIHYDSLIRANADAENGSAESVRSLLEEMKEEGIRGDSGLYHGALQALAIHPDYALRVDIMQEMKERWFGLSPEGWHSLVVGLLRDRQVELALDKLDQMHSDEILIQPWLYDISTYMLCELGELDEAYNLVRYRYENSRLGITQDHWHYLLDRFSNAYHYKATKEIWDTQVRNSELVPSDGTCVAVLNLAARNSDPALATSVVQVLSARQTPLSPFHYEALVAAYTGIEDIKTAFRVLAIMEKAGHDPSASSTRPLFLYLSTSDKLCHEAWDIVSRLHKDGHVIPVTAINVIIESLSKFGEYGAAFDYYKRLHEVCPRGPNTETINVALQGLGRTRESGKAKAMFLASEMQALKIKPDLLTYDRLILICLKEYDYEDAFRYLEEMEEVGRESVENNQTGWWMRQGTAAMMVRVCAVSGDDRAWTILERMTERGLAGARLKEWVTANWKKAEENDEKRGDSEV